MFQPEDPAASSPGRVCPGCGHVDPGIEECPLLGPERARAGGRCEILRLIDWTARRHIRLRYPERMGDLDDVVQEVWIRLARAEARREAPARGAAFRSWLRAVVANRVTDLFRRERVVARKRCGAEEDASAAGYGGRRYARP